ncbi:N-6 DNA methylase [Aeromicrobium sp.]|uniref:N-6 DNA methylase n=1 Tax=Aeromicrobium sp. TaxID=1871063 RepID=UPI0030C1DA53
MSDSAPQWLVDLVSEFGVRAKSLLAGPGEREATIRPPLDHMVTKVGEHIGRVVVMHSEVRDTERHVRPDYGVQVGGVITGYVEVKAPKVSLDPNSFRGRNLEQWNRLSDLPNLIYTNGTEWRLYRDSEPVDEPVVFSGGTLETAGASLATGPEFEALLRQFFDWEPTPIRTVPKLVATVAPLTRLLRGDVIERLHEERKAVEGGARADAQKFSGLAHEWRRLLFPDATDDRFADGYAQTVTFALLLATSDGVKLSGTNLHGVGDAMRARHSLMGRALQLLTDDMADDFRISLELLTRVIDAIDWDRIRASPRDTYLYLYEQFLEEYDPDLRQQSGSYYTPLPVVEQMVRLTEDVLKGFLGRTTGFSDPNVTVVDPAMGTGTYLHAIIEQASDQIRSQEGQGAVAGRVTDLATRLIGFELQTGPYAVAELRTSDMLRRIGANPPPGGMRTYVTNTLDDPYLESDQLGSHFRAISDSRRLANQVKANTPVTVVIGNPPYREKAEGEGGWVEAGDEAHGDRRRPILDGFRAEGNGKFEYVLKNLYVYFWRWATWKVFDSAPETAEGVVCFISTNGYQRGPGFRGMREYLRRTCTAGWIIDVSPEGHRPNVATRVFPGVQQTLSIGIFVRGSTISHDTPADISYVALSGRREDKYRALETLTLDSPLWRPARTGWQDPFTPAAESSWDDYPALNDLMPWAAPGVKPNRTWVYAPLAETLRARWGSLVAETDPDEKRRLFKESEAP